MVDTYKEINNLWFALTVTQREEVMAIERSTPFCVEAVLKTYHKCNCDRKETRSYLERVLSNGE